MSEAILTQSKLHELFFYNADTGIFTNKSNRFIGKQAGTLQKRGYSTIGIDGKRYYAHRLAWLYKNGELPSNEIDHINGVKSDNRIDNLRLATRSQNASNRPIQSNNTSGHIGITWRQKNKKWQTRIFIENKTIELGFYVLLDDAVKARKAAEARYFGEFAPS